MQWRGETETDRGFRDYFQNRRIPVELIVRNPKQDRTNFPAIVEEIKRLKPDLVYTWSMASAQGITGPRNADTPSNYVRDIPIVNCMVSDPGVAGISEGWGPSGGNFTGVSHVPDIASQLRAMQNYRDIKRIFTIYDPQQKSPVTAVEALRSLTKEQGIEFKALPLPIKADGKTDASAIPELVAQANDFKPDFFYIGPDSFLYVNRKPLFDAIAKVGVPSFAASDAFLTKGDALFGLVGNYYIVGQYCASKAVRILTEGTKPGDIPFDRVTRFSLKVNMSAAQRLKIYPPMDLLTITEVIKAPK